MAELGYTWSTNSASSYGYHSKLYPLNAIWSFAAWVITQTTTTIYLYYVGGNPVKTNLLKAVQNNITNTPESFGGGTTRLGGDINYGNGGTFDGSIDEVAVFTNALVETNVQGIFLRALGLTTGVSPSITAQPQSVTLFQGQPLVETVGAGGIPSPTYQWQGGTNAIAGNWNSSTGLVGNIGDTTGGASHGISGSTTATVTFTNYYSSFNYLRVIAANASGKVTSTWARVTLLPVLTNGLWTVNFSVTSTNNGGTGLPYVGRGVMGNNTYWNALSGPQLTNTTSLRDDGVTVSGISFGATSTVGNDSSLGGLPFDNALLDTFAQINGARAFVFNNIPNGKYNLALYGCVGSWVNRGIIFTVNGSIQSVTNVQDTIFALGDNLVMYTNISVLNQALTVSMAPVPATAAYTNSTEGDFNGAQIQLLQLGPQFTGPFTNNTLTWTGGGLYEATNIMGPWITNTATSPFVVTPTVPQKYFRVYNPTFPPN